MAHHGFISKKQAASLMLLTSLLTASNHAMAQERAEIEQLQATTTALIDLMVENGLISREKADAMLASAKEKAEQKAKLAQLLTNTPEFSKDGKKVVRVPYVPESLKQQMRDQIKLEVLAQARSERWGEPGALPAWLNRFKFQGDLRMRYDMTRLSADNTAPGSIAGLGDINRAPDLFYNTSSTNSAVPNFNSQDSFNRLRVRARLGVTASLTEQVSGQLRLTTGDTTNRTSTNQTLGQSFNKYQLVLDQAYLSIKPYKDLLTVNAGRMPNPFYGSDLLWADDLGFEGVAASFKTKELPIKWVNNASAFATAGWFPLTEDKPGTTKSRSLLGLQAGMEMNLGRSDNKLKLGVALYDYQGMEGIKEADINTSGADYVSRSEYQSGFRQRGNTLFRINGANDTKNNFGLASSFRELNVTASLDLADVLPERVILMADFVKNLGFDRKEIENRIGTPLIDGKDYGFMLRAQVGEPLVAKQGQWNAFVAYRYLGSDAVLDAFTNSDFGLGGTNNKGFMLGMNYGIYDNTWLSARWLSSNLIDPLAPGMSGSKLGVDTLWFELNFRF
jgi:DNA-binding MarR family transcriptional regulator